MVTGLDAFRKHFKEFTGQYVLIGGTACSIQFEEYDQPFRTTKDLDIVLIAEALTPEFGQAFWDFIKAGQYEICERSDSSPIFYRFQKPKAPNFPFMLELFSRSNSLTDPGSICTKIPLGEDISSLSAILLNDAYYDLLMQGRKQANDISYLSTEQLLLFKARAWLDLSDRKAAGESIDSKNILKHKKDVMHLASLLMPDQQIVIGDEIKEDLMQFLAAYEAAPLEPKQLGTIGNSQAMLLQRIKNCFGL